ncbi:ABC transporter substrate-binding protein [Prescottella equi]|uniref:Virulence factor Mce family protein n=1 Tax=Prescottella equi ATCC 33707 TaxID=525370 RepID=E9T437_RHOHA|nr:MCE family protein [Prescottella equi]EGD23004.1 virulence factor Mce family protein [Prescottella equi ATCC 33707]BCN55415.1 ABC transporter substrate-binding protein [Prescottella equi]
MIESPSKLRRRVLGVAFFLVLALFLGGTIASYNKTFKHVVKVDLVTDTVGNALPRNADVKVRGLIVGEVREASTSNGKVTSVMAIDPDKADLIPSNTTARLLPKTLFGERYVDLVIPADPSPNPIEAGGTIYQDKSGNAVELGKMLDGLLPLLQAIPPESLASTLGALSQALDSRGEQLGVTLDQLDTIFAGVNTRMPDLQAGLQSFATFTQTYSDAAPQLVDALDNLRTTNATIVQERPSIDALISSVTSTGSSTADLLTTNRDALISIAADSREALEILARFSGTFGCTFANFADVMARTGAITGENSPNPGARATIELVNPRGRYLPNQDEPRLIDTRGPRCYEPPPLGTDIGQYPGGSIHDGSYQVPTRNPGDQNIPEVAAPQYAVTPASTATLAGSPLERETLAVVYGQATGMAPEDVPAWTTTIGAPALRGKEVSVK